MLSTLENFKTYLDITSNSKDALLGIFLSASSAGIETYCGRKFNQATYSEKHHGKGGLSIFLKNYPIVSVSKIETNSGTLSTPVWEEISKDSYFVEESSGEVKFTENMSRGLGHYLVTYSAGYATIPGDLEYACLRLASVYYNVKGAGGIKSESVAGDQITFDDAVLKSGIIDTLNAYRAQYV